MFFPKKYFSIFIVIIFFFLWAPFVNSQLISHDEIIIVSKPETPGPEETVTLRADFFGSDLNRATIKWYKNGKLESQGTSVKEFSFETGPLGSQTSIRVDITTEKGEFFSKTLTVRPTSVEIVWEADTHTPPFYKGKALPSSGSNVKLVAIPEFITSEGIKIPKEDLFYKWKVDGGSNVEGKGKFVAFATAPLLSNTIKASLEVSNQERTLVKEYSTEIKMEEPEALFYKNDPLFGIFYEKAFPKSFSAESGEVTVRVEPFYLAKRSVLEGVYTWEINGKPATSHETDFKNITLVRGKDTQGRAELEINIIDVELIKQSLSDLLVISF
jgi:hypothetical protein